MWTGGRKIASIGIHVRQWVTWHGFALNVTTDLAPFQLIVPCGIQDVVMTSVEKEGARADDLPSAVRRAVVEAFVARFGYERAERAESAALARPEV